VPPPKAPALSKEEIQRNREKLMKKLEKEKIRDKKAYAKE